MKSIDKDIDEPAAKIVPSLGGNRAVITVDGETISIPLKHWGYIKSEISDAVSNLHFDMICNESEADKVKRRDAATAYCNELKESSLDKPSDFIEKIKDGKSAREFSKLYEQTPNIDFNACDMINDAMKKAYFHVENISFDSVSSVNGAIGLIRKYVANGREIVLVINKDSCDHPKIRYDGLPAGLTPNHKELLKVHGARVVIAKNEPFDTQATTEKTTVNLDKNMPRNIFSIRVLHSGEDGQWLLSS